MIHIFLEKAGACDAIRMAIEGFRPVFQVRQNIRRNFLIIFDHVAFGNFFFRKINFIKVGELESFPVDFDFHILLHLAISLFTSFGSLSGRRAKKIGWRMWLSPVHSSNLTSATSFGLTQSLWHWF